MSNYLCPTYVIKERIDLVKKRDGVKFLAYLLELKPLQGKKAIQIATQWSDLRNGMCSKNKTLVHA